MLLYCIRHGQSVYNAEGRIQGQSDIPLSELGMNQGQAAARALVGEGIDAIFSSPLTRAMQTARSVADSLDLPIETDDRLMEIHAGIFQDKQRQEIERDLPEELAHWLSEDLDYIIPGGESRRSLMTRGREAFLDIAARRDFQKVAVVGHGRMLTVTIKYVLGLEPTDPPKAIQNGSITVIRLTPDGQCELVALDQVEHLSEVGLAGSGDL